MAAAPVKGGFVREALTSHYPRLAALLEETFRRILQDTNVCHSPKTSAVTGPLGCDTTPAAAFLVQSRRCCFETVCTAYIIM